jgi:hypothetical protein
MAVMLAQLEAAYRQLIEREQPAEADARRLLSVVEDMRWYADRIGAERWDKQPQQNKWSFMQNLWHLTKLASNENMLGPSPKAIEAIQKELPSIYSYPEPACTLLRQALARKFSLPEENLVISNGADNLILLIANAFVNEGFGDNIEGQQFFAFFWLQPECGVVREGVLRWVHDDERCFILPHGSGDVGTGHGVRFERIGSHHHYAVSLKYFFERCLLYVGSRLGFLIFCALDNGSVDIAI